MSPGGVRDRVYRLALHAYPSDYRRARGDELRGVLHDREAGPGEVLAMLAHGTAARWTSTWSPAAWRPSVAVASVALAMLLGVLAGGQVLSGGIFLALSGLRPGLEGASWLALLAPLPQVVVAVLVLRGLGLPAAVMAWVSVLAAALSAVPRLPAVLTWADVPAVQVAGQGGVRLGADDVMLMATVVATLVSAVLLSGRDRVGRGLTVLGAGRSRTVLVVGAGLAYVADPTVVVVGAGVVLAASAVVSGSGLRPVLLVSAAFCYLPFAGLVDGSGERLPEGALLLAYVAVLPWVLLLGAAVLLRQAETSCTGRDLIRRALRALLARTDATTPAARTTST